MIVRFTPDAQETIRACAALTERHTRPERTQLILLVSFGLTFLLAFLIVPAQWPFVVLLSFFSTVLAFSAIRFDHQRRTAGMLAENPHFNESHEIEVTRDRLLSRCSHVAAEYAWSGIERVTENAEFYIFSNGPAAGLTVPKRALSDVEDRALREIVREAAPDRGANLAPQVGIGASVP